MVVAVGDEHVPVAGDGDAAWLLERRRGALDHRDELAGEREHLYARVAAVRHQDALAVDGDAERLAQLALAAAGPAELVAVDAVRVEHLDGVVVGVRHDDGVGGGDADERRVVEGARLADAPQQRAVPVVHEEAVHEEVGDDDVAAAVGRDAERAPH